jgi:hypothetical protein
MISMKGKPMLKNLFAGLLVAAPIVTVAVAAYADNHKHSALAHRNHSGATAGAYGFSNHRDSRADAESEAVSKCGVGCSVVLHWDATTPASKCGAYAEGEKDIYFGFSLGPDEATAKASATSTCSSAGGKSCSVRVWACE